MHQTLICRASTLGDVAGDGEAPDIGLGDSRLGDIRRMLDLTGKRPHTPVTSAVEFQAVIVQHG